MYNNKNFVELIILLRLLIYYIDLEDSFKFLDIFVFYYLFNLLNNFYTNHNNL